MSLTRNHNSNQYCDLCKYRWGQNKNGWDLRAMMEWQRQETIRIEEAKVKADFIKKHGAKRWSEIESVQDYQYHSLLPRLDIDLKSFP